MAPFQVLRRQEPNLADVLGALVRDHMFLDPLVDRLELLLAVPPHDRDTAALERELGGIAAVLENHLLYEERVLVTVLDSLQVEAASPDAQALRAPLDGIFD